MFVCTCLYARVWTCSYRGQKSQLGIFLNHPLPYSLKQSLSLMLVLTDAARQASSYFYLPRTRTVMCAAMPAIYMGSRDQTQVLALWKQAIFRLVIFLAPKVLFMKR